MVVIIIDYGYISANFSTRDRYLKIEHKIYQAIYIYIYNLMKKLDEDEMNKESKNVSTLFAL